MEGFTQRDGDSVEDVESEVAVHTKLCKAMPMCQMKKKFHNPCIMWLRKESIEDRNGALGSNKLWHTALKGENLTCNMSS